MMRFTRISQAERTHEPETLLLLQKVKVLATGVKIPRPENHQTPADFGFEFETVHFIGAHGLRIEAWRIRSAGGKGTVVLLHGYTSSKESLLPAAKEFDALGFDTVLVDFYGSGGSEGNETSVGYYEADDVATAFRFVQSQNQMRTLVLYGVSMGAAAVLRAVHAHDIEPDALILECPFDRMLTTVQHRFEAMRLPQFPAAQLLVFWGGVQQSFNAFGHNPADYASSVRCPTLLMHGGKDTRVSTTEVENIRRNLNGASVLKLFPESPHQSYVVSRGSEWRSSVGEFLNTVPPPAQK